MKRAREKVVSVCLFLVVLTFFIPPKSWSTCVMCQELGGGVQLCNGIGLSTCGLYFAFADNACCSPSGYVACGNGVVRGGMYYYYSVTSGNWCSGIYLCSGGTSPDCNGDFIVAGSGNCTPVGGLLPYSAFKVDCE